MLDIKPGGRHWISKDLLYEPTKNGGFGIIKLSDFTRAIKCSWLKRYTVDQLDDHWADMLDKHFSLTPDTRKTILTYGPEQFNDIIKKNPWNKLHLYSIKSSKIKLSYHTRHTGQFMALPECLL